MYDSFWGLFFEDVEAKTLAGEVMVPCPFHLWNLGKDNDETPAMSINIETGKYICFACKDIPQVPLRAQGDAEAFVMSYFDVDYSNAKSFVAGVLGDNPPIYPIDEAVIIEWQKGLANATKIVDRLKERRGFTDETIKKFELGWDGHRITIPIRNYRGDVVNVRRYLLSPIAGQKTKNKMVSLSPGVISLPTQILHYKYSKPRLWPTEWMTRPDPVIVMGGEMDTLLGNQLGLNAVTGTGGEGTWGEGWSEYFVDREVYICFDIDKAGKVAAQKVAVLLNGKASLIHIVTLPISDPPNGDFSDWITKTGLGEKEAILAELQVNSVVYAIPTQTADIVIPSNTEPTDVTLVEATYSPEWQGQRVRMRALVAGKSLTPFSIARNITLQCNKMDADNPLCRGCAINHRSGTVKVVIDKEDDILHLIKVSDEGYKDAIAEIAGVPAVCPKWTSEVEASQNVDEAFITPEVEPGVITDSDNAHTMQMAFYAYSKGAHTLEANQTYEMVGVTTTDPWKQRVAHLIQSIKPVQDTVRAFKLTDDVRVELEGFRVPDGLSVKEWIHQIGREISYHVSHIYGREDLVAGLLLSYCSIQQFRFQKQVIDNGLVEGLVIGDTRTGKSETAASLSRWLKLGTVVIGEGTSFAGLVGGLQQGADGSWFTTWGKIPQNNGRLVVIDETSGLSIEAIGNMSGIRSSRIAELTKVRQAKTSARTRLVWMSNPRPARSLRSYSHGVEAVSELIGKPEDVARFDYVLSCASGEVAEEVINQYIDDMEEHPPMTISQVGLHQLILWAWSRGVEHVEFTEAATRMVLVAATEQGKMYSSAIPLVEPANQRIKLARLAVSTAALCYSSDDDGEKVVVLPEHVEYARQFLDEAYAKPSLDYLGFSEKEKEDERIANSSRDIITKWITNNRTVAELIYRAEYFHPRDLCEQLSMSDDEAKDAIFRLSKSHMIDRTHKGYRKTAPFIQLVKEVRVESKGRGN